MGELAQANAPDFDIGYLTQMRDNVREYHALGLLHLRRHPRRQSLETMNECSINEL